MTTHRATFLAIALLLAFSGSRISDAQCTGGGTPIQQGCDEYTWEGCCDGEVLYWCEGNWICSYDCSQMPYCGWMSQHEVYNCGTSGNPAPNDDPPIVCPGLDGDDDGWTTGDGDCDDLNPDVNPGADEVCGNGVDDDCDGNADGDDPDCQGDDDDAGDDADAGDDDSGDDDSGGDDDGEGDDDGGMTLVGDQGCGCQLASADSHLSWLVALGAIGLLAGRRRCAYRPR